ncbi:MAG TPA: c-type cytochrome [Nannocystaceae bacterium]|nr:c-type cytochrome [Nannocystaceae bacterium]
MASSRTFFVVLALAACSPASEDASDTTSTSDASSSGADTSSTGEPIDGEQLFLGTCAPCHGTQGEGTVLGYGLQHPERDYATWVVRNGRMGTELAPSIMAAYSDAIFSDAELEAMFDYLDSFPKPTDGEGLYLDYCRNCHGVDAAGGEAQKDIRLEIVEALEKVREGEGGTDYGARLTYMPSWTTDELSNDDVAAIVAYVQSL